jgi:hypothetical protein
MQAPILQEAIPDQIINEQAAYGPFDLKKYIPQPAADSPPLQFEAGLVNDRPLPQGLICTSDGILTGIPAKGAQGVFKAIVTAKNEAGSVEASFVLIIKESFLEETASEYFDKLKTQVWEAIHQKLPIPDFAELQDQPITAVDIYYLLERWGILIIWNAFDLEAPSEKRLLNLEGTSAHYNIFDCGSCLIAAPKDLYSHERTIKDGLITARVMAREVFNRNWATIELVGLNKLTRSAWVEVQLLGDQHGRRLEVINYNPTGQDAKVYHDAAIMKAAEPRPEGGG